MNTRQQGSWQEDIRDSLYNFGDSKMCKLIQAVAVSTVVKHLRVFTTMTSSDLDSIECSLKEVAREGKVSSEVAGHVMVSAERWGKA